MITTLKLINIVISSCSYHFFICGGTFKIYPLNKFQEYKQYSLRIRISWSIKKTTNIKCLHVVGLGCSRAFYKTSLGTLMHSTDGRANV